MKNKPPLPTLLQISSNKFKHYCFACDEQHTVVANTPNRNNAIWSFNNDLVKPTFYPDFMTITVERVQGRLVKKTGCHYWIQNGKITYTLNGTHPFIGKTLDLVPFIVD